MDIRCATMVMKTVLEQVLENWFCLKYKIAKTNCNYNSYFFPKKKLIKNFTFSYNFI